MAEASEAASEVEAAEASAVATSEEAALVAVEPPLDGNCKNKK